MLEQLTHSSSDISLAHYLAQSQLSGKRFLSPEISTLLYQQLFDITHSYDLAIINFLEAGEKAALSVKNSKITGVSFTGTTSFAAIGLLEPDLK